MVTNEPLSTAVVTGASSGIGLALTSRLLTEGWRVVTLQRAALPPEGAVFQRALAEARLRPHRVDLSDLAALPAIVAQIAEEEPSIDLLVNNAAVSLDAPRAAPSGRDVHLDVNVLAPYVLVDGLLASVARSTHKQIVNVSSNACLGVGQLSFEELAHPTRFEKLFGPYAASKLALSLWTHDLAPRLSRDVELRSVCPGANDTPMTRGKGMPGWLRLVVPLLFGAPDGGAGRIWSAALGTSKAPRGAFVHKGKATPLPCLAQASTVHTQVRALLGLGSASG
jgi:NAD(P)-dependent dehydrogenase (short-subunit alcohol dehydrogenase family)